jgi:hypothetical protein
MSFVNFYLFNDEDQVVQLTVYDCVDQNNPLTITTPDYPGQSPFPVVDRGQTAVLRATALQDGGNTASVLGAPSLFTSNARLKSKTAKFTISRVEKG